MARRRYLIIGDGAAGTSAAQHVRSADPDGLIAIYSDDPHPAYFRAALTNYLLGELTEDQLWAVPPNFYRENQIHRVLARVAAVDGQRREVHLTSGGPPVPYDSLMVATGSRARPPPFRGGDLHGVMTMRTLQDARDMMDLLKRGTLKRAVVLGGGPLGLEWAQGLTLRGVQVTLLMRENRFLAGLLDDVASDLLLSRLRQAGVEVGLSEEVESGLPTADGRLGAVVTKSGHTLACDLVGVAIGVVSNSDFLQSSGVALGKTRGVMVDDHLRSSIPGVFAAGDVAEHQGRTLQLWEPARTQARVAGINMSGGEAAYRPGAHYLATRLYDLDFASVGTIADDPRAQQLVAFPRSTGRISYRKVVVKDGRLVGALMLGEREERVRQRGRIFKKFIDEGLEIASIQDKLLDPTFDLNGWMRTKTLLKKPEPALTGARSVASPAGMRKTQALQMAPSKAPTPPAGEVGAQLPPGTELGRLEGAAGRYSLTGPLTSIGRDASNQIRLEDPGVSYLHAQIARHENDLYVRDLGSRNGTWVNNTQVTVPHRLRPGDRLRIGNTELAFFSTTAAAPDAPSQAAPTGPSATGVTAPHLEIRSGHAIGINFALATGTTTLGRDPTSTIRFDDLSVSFRHAVVTERGGTLVLVDHGSTNGTFYRGQRLTAGSEVVLQEGDPIALGQVAMVFSSRPLASVTPMSAWGRETPAPPAVRACTGCGTPLVIGARFCNSCGFPAPAGGA